MIAKAASAGIVAAPCRRQQARVLPDAPQSTSAPDARAAEMSGTTLSLLVGIATPDGIAERHR